MGFMAVETFGNYLCPDCDKLMKHLHKKEQIFYYCDNKKCQKYRRLYHGPKVMLESCTKEEIEYIMGKYD